jgi:hypothetical protein
MKIKDLKRKIKIVSENPKVILIKLLHFVSPLMGDKLYLKLIFPLYTGYRLNLKNPQTYNQKLQWLKINYRKPIMTKMVDKYEAKEIVKKIVGEQYVVKNYGVWNTFDEIDFDSLPKQFVLKTTHDQGGVVICKDKLSFDYKTAREKLNNHLNTKHYFLSREWPYKNVTPRILAEEYLSFGEEDLKDYKFFCFNGKVKALFIASERQSGKEVKFDFYDKDYNFLDIVQTHPQSGKINIKPANFSEMISLAEKLSQKLPHLRVDFYNIRGNIYFGEFTFSHHGGLVSFHPEKWDYKFGEWINIESVKAEL